MKKKIMKIIIYKKELNLQKKFIWKDFNLLIWSGFEKLKVNGNIK